MYRCLLAVAALFMVASVTTADEKADRVKKLKEQIAETEKKLADLKKDLAKEEPEPMYTDAKEELWARGAPEVGTRGWLATTDHKVVEVIDGETAAVQFGISGRGPTFLVSGVPTKGWADDMYVRSQGAWNVSATRKHGGKTMFVLTPTNGATFVKAK